MPNRIRKVSLNWPIWNAGNRATAIKVTIDGCARNETPFDPRLVCRCGGLGHALCLRCDYVKYRVGRERLDGFLGTAKSVTVRVGRSGCSGEDKRPEGGRRNAQGPRSGYEARRDGRRDA